MTTEENFLKAKLDVSLVNKMAKMIRSGAIGGSARSTAALKLFRMKWVEPASPSFCHQFSRPLTRRPSVDVIFPMQTSVVRNQTAALAHTAWAAFPSTLVVDLVGLVVAVGLVHSIGFETSGQF